MAFAESAFDALIRPGSIAVIGASTNPNKPGGIPMTLLTRLGYAGTVYPVNPQATEVQGRPAVRSILDVPGPVDLAIVAVPAAGAEQAIREAVQAGVRAVVMFTSGFAEAGAEGAAQQDAVARVARDAGLVLLGPNCLGVMSMHANMFATFSPAPLAGRPPAGNVGLVSQSGAFGAYAFSLARKADLGLSHWVTTGNEATVTVADLVDWMAGDPETSVILAYLEGCRDGARLQQALARARSVGKPVVVTKVGRTAAGARAAMSHTASVAGEDSVFDAVFEEAGAIRAHTIEEFFRLGQTFAVARPVARRSLAIVTVSGGVGTLMADRAEDLGLALPPLDDAEAAQLQARVPFSSAANPIDVTGQITGDPQVLDLACDLVADSGRYGAAAIFLVAGAMSPAFWPAVERCAQRMQARHDMTTVLAGIFGDEQRRQLAALGCLVFEEPTHAIEAIDALSRGPSQARPVDSPEAAIDAAAAARTLDALPGGDCNEAEGLALLERAGLAAVPHRIAVTADEAARAAEALGFPVVIKLLSRDVLHKTDVGGVRLGVGSAAEAAAAFDDIRSSAAVQAPDARFEGVLVARMIKPVVECMLGARRDPVFGPIVAFGLGGTAVEWLDRVAVATAPATPARIAMLLERLGITTLLDGWRGAEPISPDALVDAIRRTSELAAAVGERLQTIEVNPLMVTPDGVFAADAVVQLEPPGAQRAGHPSHSEMPDGPKI